MRNGGERRRGLPAHPAGRRERQLQLTVEGSATGAFGGEETTLASFDLDGSEIGSERVSIDGPMPRYTRWRSVRTGAAGDDLTFAVNLVRQ